MFFCYIQVLVIKKFKDLGVTKKFKELTEWLVKVSLSNKQWHWFSQIVMYTCVLS